MRQVERFTDFIQAHVEKTDPNRIFIDKETTRRIAKECGVALPDLFQIKKRVEDIDFSSLPDAFVLKPTHFASKKGVYVLFRVRDRFLDLFTKRVLSEDEIVSELSNTIGNQFTNVMVEEFISGENGSVEIPYDYKLYTFDAGVKLIIQINRNTVPNEICVFDGDFIPVGPDTVRMNEKHVKNGEPRVPGNADMLLQVAMTAQQSLDRPFISVDCFTTGDRVVLGELTPCPGGRLCCTNPMTDSPRESSVVAGGHEQTHAPRLQDQELAGL